MVNTPIRVLQVVPNMNSGGIENYIMNMLRTLDRSKIHFDFLEHHSGISFFDKEIESFGCKIYRIPVVENRDIIAYYKELNKLFQENNYQIVHGHMASLAVFYLYAAQQNGVPVRIVHSHGTSHLNTLKGYMKYILFKQAKRYANVRFACSKEAGEYLFGNNTFTIVKNAIDTSRFAFDKDLRDFVRKKIGINESTFLIGHIGRFNLQKNHEFLIEILKSIRNIRSDVKLLLVGEGETKERIVSMVKDLSLSENVIFQNVTNDPQAWYSAMDALVMPSLFEGLPLVGIEAQCSGLPCFFSSSITREVKISNLSHFISLNDSPDTWAKDILLTSKDILRSEYKQLVKKTGYDCYDNTRKMELLYQNLLKEYCA